MKDLGPDSRTDAANDIIVAALSDVVLELLCAEAKMRDRQEILNMHSGPDSCLDASDLAS